MKVVTPKPFTYKGGEKAVLLLHGFTGNPVDVKKLGRYLNERGYTCLAPVYKGHGVTPEELVQTGPEDWWQSVLEGYQSLKEEGYEEIAVAGLSMGGVFSLKLGYTLPVKGIVTMCSPMYRRSEEGLYKRVLDYARNYKKFEGKNDDEISTELEEFKKIPVHSLKEIQELILDVSQNLDTVFSPLFVIQGRQDHTIDTNSANIIYDKVNTYDKQIKWYEESGHIITLDKEKEQVYEDIYEFLESL